MRYDQINYDLELSENEQCFYHGALNKAQRPMCLGVSEQALFILKEKFLKIEAYSIRRIPLAGVKEVVLSRERGWRVWLKAGVLLAFGAVSMIAMAIGQWLSPNMKPSVIGTGGPLFFLILGVIMLIDNRWRLVLTIKTEEKVHRWRPHLFDKREEVKSLQEGFLAACRYVGVRTHRLDLVNEREITQFWAWFVRHADKGKVSEAAVSEKLHKVCDRIDVEFDPDGDEAPHEMVITANYAADAFPIVEEIVFAAPKIPDLSIKAFRPRRPIGDVYRFEDEDHSLEKVFFIPYSDGFELAVEIFAETDLVENSLEFFWAFYKHLLGEYDSVLGIGYVQIKDLAEVKDVSALQHISQLPAVIDEFHCFEID